MLTTKDAANYLGLKKSTLEAWRCHGGGPVFHKFGKAIRYDQTDLDAFKTQCRRKNTSRA